MAATIVITVNSIIGKGSSIFASIGDSAVNALAKKLQKPKVAAAHPTGNRIGCTK